jgi:hypothetical protein
MLPQVSDGILIRLMLSTLGLPNGQFGPSWGRQLQALGGVRRLTGDSAAHGPFAGRCAAPNLRNRPMIHAPEGLGTPAGFAPPVAQHQVRARDGLSACRYQDMLYCDRKFVYRWLLWGGIILPSLRSPQCAQAYGS